LRDRECAFGDTVGGDFMANIDHTSVGSDPRDHAFHYSDIVVAKAEIGGQGY
jgi:hypothetical protein